MINKTNQELKKIARRALERRYGFAPTLNKITLLEAHGDGTYIRFKVSEIEYKLEISEDETWFQLYQV